jgi:hypothetical protein
MEANNLVEECSGDSGGGVRVTQWHKVLILGETVHNRQDHRLPIHLWKPLDEVECNVRPNRRRHLQRLQQPSRMKMVTFVALTYDAGAHKLTHQGPVAWNVEVYVHSVQGLLCPLVPRPMRIVEDGLQGC